MGDSAIALVFARRPALNISEEHVKARVCSRVISVLRDRATQQWGADHASSVIVRKMLHRLHSVHLSYPKCKSPSFPDFPSERQFVSNTPALRRFKSEDAISANLNNPPASRSMLLRSMSRSKIRQAFVNATANYNIRIVKLCFALIITNGKITIGGKLMVRRI
jgi:hypothetical protein